MSVVRGLARGLSGLIALGVGALILVPVAIVIAALSIPILILFAAAGLIGGVALVSSGVPIVGAILGLVALIAIAVLLAGAISLGVLALKLMLFGLLLAWLARRLMGWSVPRRRRAELVGNPVVDIAAPSTPRRDKYDIAAERELDEHLGL